MKKKKKLTARKKVGVSTLVCDSTTMATNLVWSGKTWSTQAFSLMSLEDCGTHSFSCSSVSLKVFSPIPHSPQMMKVRMMVNTGYSPTKWPTLQKDRMIYCSMEHAPVWDTEFAYIKLKGRCIYCRLVWRFYVHTGLDCQLLNIIHVYVPLAGFCAISYWKVAMGSFSSFFNVHMDLSACCAQECKMGTTVKSAQILIWRDWKTALHPVAPRNPVAKVWKFQNCGYNLSWSLKKRDLWYNDL